MASHGVFISQMVVPATPGTRCERIRCRARLSQWLSENSTDIDSSTTQLINLLHQAENEIKDKEKALLETQLQIKDKDEALLEKDLAQLDKALHQMTAEKPLA